MSRRSVSRPFSAKRRRRRDRGLLPWIVGFLIAAAVIAAAVALPVLSTRGGGDKPLTAVIVDQLALTEPNPAFAQEATRTLQQAGYRVDYAPGEQVTVDYYRDLPSLRYDLIVLRVHTARFEAQYLTMDDPVERQRIIEAFGEDVFLFTAETYERAKYPAEREELRLFAVRYRQGGDTRYFGVAPEFVQSSMRGDFDGATILVMGCDGLLFDNTPQALVDKGARAVVGWDGLVSAQHTDAATLRLLHYLMVEGLTYGQAIQKALADVGTDPSYESALQIYPSSAGIATLR